MNAIGNTLKSIVKFFGMMGIAVVMFQNIHFAIPVTDCNLYLSTGEMQSGYRKESTIYSDDCVINWNPVKIKVYEDGSFILTIPESERIYRTYIPMLNNRSADSSPGFGFGCDVENEIDHILIACETTDGSKFPYTAESTIGLNPLGSNQFTGCLPFGICAND